MSNFSSPVFDTSFDAQFIPIGMAASAPPDVHEGSKRAYAIKKSTKLWTYAENEILFYLVPQHYGRNWGYIAQLLSQQTGYPLKSPAQVSQHWRRTLCSSTKKWTKDEDNILIYEYQQLGNSWSQISQKLQGRTDLQVKFRFEVIRKHYDL